MMGKEFDLIDTHSGLNVGLNEFPTMESQRGLQSAVCHGDRPTKKVLHILFSTWI